MNYTLDANGSMTSDGLRTFEYDANHRLAKVLLSKDSEAAAIDYLHNAVGQRVFKSEPQVEQTLPKEDDLGPGFINWLKKNFGWMFLKGKKAKGQLGESFVYGDGEIPEWALLGSYDNGTATGKGTSEFIWLPTEDGMAIPVGLYRAGKFYAIHSDHLGTPRLMTDSVNKPVWQWPYSGFGNNKPTGVLATVTANGVPTTKASKPAAELSLRFPGQFADDETGTFYNFLRDSMDPAVGRYRQADPIRLRGGLNIFGYAANSPLIFIDPTGLKQKARSSYCKDLRKKMDNIKKDLDKRWIELADDPLGLPERLGAGEKLSATKRGHRTLINQRDRSLRDIEKKYSDECEEDDGDAGRDSCNECSAGAVAATMVGGYLVYRCVRMLPSLLPPLWPTIPANVVLP